MNNFDNLIESLKSNHKIIRLKELEELLRLNNEFKDKFNELKIIQKQIVHNEHHNVDCTELKEKHSYIYNTLVNDHLAIEYLELQEEVNMFLDEVKDIFLNEL